LPLDTNTPPPAPELLLSLSARLLLMVTLVNVALPIAL